MDQLSVPLLLLLIFLFFACESTRAANPAGMLKLSKVFSLFNLKSSSKFWTESVIRSDFDDLEGSVLSEDGKKALLNYTHSGNIANYMRLSEVESVYISIPVNFIFIGFEGKGNHEFKLCREEIERWFTELDHIFEHTRIPPLGEILTPFYKTSVDKVRQHHLPLVSHINYNFSVHAIHMGEKVTSVVQYAIKALSRRDDLLDSRGNEEVLWQVDLDHMEYVFSTLINYLQIEDAYNIFILNPKRNDKRLQYGYRTGLSGSEISLLKENKTLVTRIIQSKSNDFASLEIEKIVNPRPLYGNRPSSNFAWTATEDIDTMEWSKKCMEALTSFEHSQEGKDNVELLYDKAARIFHGKDDDVRFFLGSELKSGDLNGLHPECLTDSWISKDRWVFIDLSAGPFTWGPTVGGEGVRTEVSLPNVGRTMGTVAEIMEDEAEDKLQEAIKERFSSFSEEHQAIDILLAEIDIYELFSFQHCKGRRVKIALCEELDERMHDLKSELEGYKTEEYSDDNKKKAVDALKRMESWNLFSGTPVEHKAYTVARDSFLAHLGSTLWGSMRHIISPSVSDRQYHFYDKLSFQLYFITHERMRSIKQLPVNIKALSDGISSLLVPFQTVMFSQHLLSLAEDPALTMAFAVARRAAAVPLLLVNGTYMSAVRTYLDSSILQHQLQRLSIHGSLKGAHLNSRSTLEIPIFWFINADPLLVDKHYQAKALSNMVIVVQSEASSWESHLQCNGKPLLLDLRRPIKAAIAATGEHLAGLLPLHLIYSHAHGTAVEDWTWSIGCNPYSLTSSGWQLSQFQKDAIARSYIITSLEESIQLLNGAINRLIAERTSAQSFANFKYHERVVVEKYNSVISLWRRISSICGGLRYGDAVRLVQMLDDASHGFSNAVNATISMLHPIHCTRKRMVDIEFDLTTVPPFLVVAAILWFILRPRNPKPKIN